MATAIEVRTDYTSEDLLQFSRRVSDAAQVRRLLAVALILDGGSRSEAAKVAGVTLQIVRDWVLRFNEGGPVGLATRKAPGRAPIMNDEQRARLAEQVETGLSQRRMGLCAGDCAIWRSGSGTSSHCRSRALAVSFARWAIASSQCGRVIAARRTMMLPILNRLHGPPGADQAAAPERHADRAMVAG